MSVGCASNVSLHDDEFLEIRATCKEDQLNARNSDLNCLDEEIISLQLKLANMENLEEVRQLREQMKISESERLLLMEENEDKEVIIRNSASCVEKLEESISSMGLEYECEMESTKLELIALEQNFFEAKKLLEEKTQPNSAMNELIQDLELQIQDAEKVIEILSKENKDLKEKVKTSELNAKEFSEKMEEQFNGSLWKNGYQPSKTETDRSTRGHILGPQLSKFVAPEASDAELRNKMAEMKCQIDNYEFLVKQLKYQITVLLEEECKRRACIEQISLQRIAELEAQVGKTPIAYIPHGRDIVKIDEQYLRFVMKIAKEQQKSYTSQSFVVRNINKT